ncbi:MAG: indole-3-glycerol phosphate synthase TrpC [Thermodesulfovibrionia bacterium]
MLEEILRNKREEIKERKMSVSLRELKDRARDAQPTRNLKDAIKRKGGPLRLIAEVKRASPSSGIIRTDFNLNEILSIYEERGVDAISILTDERFFGGRIDYLNIAKKLTTRPTIRKDFIIDDYQLYESRVHGADGVLLIVSALERSQLIDLMGIAKELSLDCLIEVHDYRELDTALYCDAEIIGINNRNLKTLRIDLDTTFELIKDMPDDRVIVSESGIETRGDVERIEATRVDAILVGTSLMKSRDISKKIDELRGEGG